MYTFFIDMYVYKTQLYPKYLAHVITVITEQTALTQYNACFSSSDNVRRIANSVLFRANIPRSDGFHNLEQFYLC